MRKIAFAMAGIVLALAVALTCGGMYMLSYSLTPDPNRQDTDSAYRQLFRHYPYMAQWTDSMRRNGVLRDTFVTMPSGERHHALFARCDSAHGRTAIIVHGYKDCAVKFLFLGRMYHHDMGHNILLPDLHAHGLSEGGEIQMGWKDRKDVEHWAKLAAEMFGKGRTVIHGVSMGAATTMCVSGDSLPDYISCFVEDCGYTSVWDEFAMQLKEQFGLPEFPLMHATSLLCRLRYGWSFGEASPIRQVAKCQRPMLFIHGDTDSFVPTWMAKPLYEAKPGRKELWLTAGSEHALSFKNHPKEYKERVERFVNGK